MQPIAASLTAYLRPSEQEQAPFPCEETANGQPRISTLAVATVDIIAAPNSTSSIHLQINEINPFKHISGYKFIQLGPLALRMQQMPENKQMLKYRHGTVPY